MKSGLLNTKLGFFFCRRRVAKLGEAAGRLAFSKGAEFRPGPDTSEDANDCSHHVIMPLTNRLQESIAPNRFPILVIDSGRFSSTRRLVWTSRPAFSQRVSGCAKM
ncbi:hypothetical protein J6590_017743 [Homalodisca vitripennis]|nr:hypothetical protein J6590_017743 [Homalodisca vitripennis]